MKLEGVMTAIGGCALVVVLAMLAITDNVPVPETSIARHQREGCTLLSSLKTEEMRYCGKACWLRLYANTYKCGATTKTLIETN